MRRGTVMATVAAIIVMMVVALGGAEAAAEELQPEVDALVRVVHAAPTLAAEPVTATVGDATSEDIRFGAAGTFRRVPAGNRPVAVRTTAATVASATLGLRAGCRHTIVVAQPDGLRRPARLIDVPECGIARLSPGVAGIRLLNATADNGAVVLVSGGMVPTAPFAASARAEVHAGQTTVQLRSPATGEMLAKASFILDEGSAYTVAYVGGGEVPLRLVLFLDGLQPPRPPDPTIPINTGTGPHRGMSGITVVLVVLVLVTLGVGGFGGARLVVETLHG